jgi:hypothetical protein
MHPRRLTWRRRHRQVAARSGPAAYYEITYANPGRRRVPAAIPDEASALGTARNMSARGDLVDVTLVGEDGTRRPVASYADGQPVPGVAARIPAAASATRAPVSRLRGPGDSQAAAQQYPGGIWPLPVVATSGGPLRPRRLLHPDGTRLECRPEGPGGPRLAAVADGVAPPAAGPDGPWLQVVRLDNTRELVTLHPALVSPAGVDPYACMDRRQRRRFSEFDAAEAAGLDAARLRATLVDIGDFITADDLPDLLLVTQNALACGAIGVSVRLIGRGLNGTGMLVGQQNDLVQVTIPDWHPAESGPQARRLFARGQPHKVIRVPRPALIIDGGR